MKKKKICANCHFLAPRRKIETTDPDGVPRNSTENRPFEYEVRKELIKGNFGSISDYYIMYCHFLVWHEGDFPEENDKSHMINGIIRDDCFYFEYRPNMNVEAAEILQEREYNLTEKEKDRRYTRLALYIAVIALVINTIIQILAFLFKE